jgi:hypothetical protein
MAESVDGDIRLSVTLDTNTVKQQANKLKQDMDNAMSTSSTRKQTAQMASLENKMAQTSGKAQELLNQMRALENTKVPTQEYTEITKQIADAETALRKLQERMDKFLETGGKTSSKSWKSMQYDMAQLENTIEYAKGELQDLVDTGKAFQLGSDTEDYSKLTAQLDAENTRLSSMLQRYNNQVNTTNQSVHTLKNTTQTLISNLGRQLETINKKINGVLSSIFNKVKQIFSHTNKSSKNLNTSLSGGLKTVLKYAFGIRSMYVLFRKLRAAVIAGFENLMGYDAQLKTSINTIKADLLTIKNAFAAAFEPIVSIALPYIDQLMNYIINLINLVGQFTASITGQKTYTKAVKQTADAIEDANSATSKQLSSLDKLNNITTTSGSGSGTTDTSGMFEEAEIDSKIADLAQSIKDMWKDADFTDLGKNIGEWLKNALDNIPWDEIKEKARKIGKSIATLINGFVEVEGLGYSIGNTLAQAINTAFEFLNSFVHNLHWWSIGKFIADTLNGFFENIDWNLIYDAFVTGFRGLAYMINAFIYNFHWDNLSTAIANFVNTITTSIYAFFMTVDWSALGHNIGDQIIKSIRKIDWEMVGKALGSVIQSALDFLTSFVKTMDWNIVVEAIRDAIKGFAETVDMGTAAEAIVIALAAKMALKVAVNSASFSAIGSSIGGFVGAACITAIIAYMTDEQVRSNLADAWDWLTGDLHWFWESDEDASTNDPWRIKGMARIMEEIEKGVTFTSEQLDTLKEKYRLTDADIQALNESMVANNKDLATELSNFTQKFPQFANLTTSQLKQVYDQYNNVGYETLGTNGEILREMESNVNDWAVSIDEAGNATLLNVQGTTNKIDMQIDETTGKVTTNVQDANKAVLDDTTNTYGNVFTVIDDNGNEITVSLDNNTKQWTTDFNDFDKSATNATSDVAKNTKTDMSSVQTSIKETDSKLSANKSSFSSWADSCLTSVKNFVSDALSWLGSLVDKLKEVIGLQSSASSGSNSNSTSTRASGSYTVSRARAMVSSVESSDIPALAKGTVVPPNRQFMAILGDNKKETEVVSPLSTIEQAVENAMARSGANQEITLNIPVELDGKVIFNLMRKYDKEYLRTHGNPAFE